MTRPRNSDCEQFHDAMWLYLSRELDDSQRSGWEKHLAECERCRRSLKGALTALDTFDRAPKPAPPGPVLNRVLARSAAGVGSRAGYRRVVAPILALAAVLLVALGHPDLIPVGSPAMNMERVRPAISSRIIKLDSVFAIRSLISDPGQYVRRKQETCPLLRMLSQHLNPFWIGSVTRTLEQSPDHGNHKEDQK